MSTDGERLASLSRAVRESTLKRLRQVPPDFENWRISTHAMSFADVAHHLVEADHWLFQKLKQPSLQGIDAVAGEAGEVDGQGFRRLITELEETGEQRARLLVEMSPPGLAEMIPDDRFGGEVSVWWVIVRGNLDHEAHHRGQIAAYLRALQDRHDSHGS